MSAIKLNIKKEKCLITISRSVQDVFSRYRQVRYDDSEACGILIGNHRVGGKVIFIKFATIPQVKDIRKRNSYKINSVQHQSFLDKCFKNSDNEDVYIGTWHTHPENDPLPSNSDVKDWKKQYMINLELFNRMVFAIIGIEKTKYWIIENGNLNLLQEGSIKYDKNN